jgi:hypothetical protein
MAFSLTWRRLLGKGGKVRSLPIASFRTDGAAKVRSWSPTARVRTQFAPPQ